MISKELQPSTRRSIAMKSKKKFKCHTIKANKVETITKFPEILGGRVKTLHPKIFGGILGDVNNVSHLKDMQNHKLEKFELVIVNLYPFEKVIEKTNNIQKCIENIDDIFRYLQYRIEDYIDRNGPGSFCTDKISSMQLETRKTLSEISRRLPDW